jgi:hypothetical protein
MRALRVFSTRRLRLVVPATVLALAGCGGGSKEASDDKGSAGAPAKTASGASDKGGLLNLLKPDPVVVPEDTRLPLVLETTVSSKTSHKGDLVVAKLAEDVKVGERVVLPEGTELRGHVTSAVPSGKVKGVAHLAFDFDTLLLKGQEHAVETRTVSITAPKTHKRDAAIIGGGAGAGALIGAIVDGKKGAGVGALVGGAAGTGVVLTTTGKEVQIPAGSRLSIKLTREARLG